VGFRNVACRPVKYRKSVGRFAIRCRGDARIGAAEGIEVGKRQLPAELVRRLPQARQSSKHIVGPIIILINGGMIVEISVVAVNGECCAERERVVDRYVYKAMRGYVGGAVMMLILPAVAFRP
jgi:hypothetical protein